MSAGFTTATESEALDKKQSSYQFHRGLESPYAFFRREWKATLFFAGSFCLVTLLAILYIDPAFFYPRLQTDPLNYYLKAKALVETGSTSARWAVNLKPFAYAAFPGVLRAPAMLVFHDFDDQLRAIQILNIPIVAGVALMSAYMLSWTQPVKRHWMTIGFAFAFTVLSPFWMMNVFLPLADAPYALFTLLTLLVSMSLVCSDAPPSRRPLALLAFVALFVISFPMRFTAPVLLVFPAVLGLGRWRHAALSPRVKVTLVIATLAGVMLLVLLNLDAIFGRYFFEPIAFLIKGDKPGMLLNLLGAAVPSQVVPDFQQGFVHPPITELFRTTFATSALDMAWLGVGLAVCAVVIAGMWISRRRFLPEIFYLLAPLPVLALMMPSTTRYLMSYQAILWIFFFTGLQYALAQHVSKLPRFFRSRGFAMLSLALAAVVVIGLRSWRLGATASERYFAVTVSRAPRYITDVSTTFRGLRRFLETLPRDSTLLIGARGTGGRWTAISGMSYYAPDSALSSVAGTRKVYLLVECGTMEDCQAWDQWKRKQEDRVTKYGDFAFSPVYSIIGQRARVEVLRLENAGPIIE